MPARKHLFSPAPRSGTFPICDDPDFQDQRDAAVRFVRSLHNRRFMSRAEDKVRIFVPAQELN